MFASVVDADDVGMAQSCGQVGFADEPLPERGVAGDVGAKHLEGILAGQAGMLDQVDLAHSAGAEQPQNPVSGEGLPNPQRHGRMLVADVGVLRHFSVPGPPPMPNWSRPRPGQTAQPVSLGIGTVTAMAGKSASSEDFRSVVLRGRTWPPTSSHWRNRS